MSNYHPSSEFITAFVAGDLPASISAAVAIHLDHCQICAKKVASQTAINAEAAFLDTPHQGAAHEIDFADMIQSITSNTQTSLASELEGGLEADSRAELEIEIKGKAYTLPRSLRSMAMSGWLKMGKISRSRIDLNEGEIHTSLLHIDATGSVPEHTHKGYEITVLIAGEFFDEMGTYRAGDFIYLDNNHTHTPVSQAGCLCYTVSDDAQIFTQGLSKILNPLGRFIY